MLLRGKFVRTAAIAVGAVGLVGGGLVGGATPAGAQALVVECNRTPAGPEAGGVVVFLSTGSGSTFLGNCHLHEDVGTTGPASGRAVIIECDDIEDFEYFRGYMVGRQVVTPTGDVHTTCHPHNNPGMRNKVQ